MYGPVWLDVHIWEAGREGGLSKNKENWSKNGVVQGVFYMGF